MIRILSLSFLLFLALETIGQTAKKYLFTERFTNTICTPCATENMVFFDIVENHEGDMHHLTVHPAIPSASCPFYLENVNDNTARKNFNEVTETPTVLLNGEATMGTAIITDEAIKQRLNQRTSLGVEVNVDITGIEMRGTVNVYTTGDIPSGDLRLMIAAVEEVVDFSAINGEAKHYNVLRKLAKQNGDSFTPADTGSARSFSFDFKSEFNWDINEMYILAWIENRSTKEVLNSGSQFDPPINFEPSNVNDPLAISFSIVPNPASDFLDIKLEQPTVGQFEIWNLDGKQISTTDVGLIYSKSLNISDLAKGMYILKIKTENGIGAQRFLKY